MVRNYIRKTTRGSYCKEKFREAVRAIQNGELSGYKAAKLYGIPRMTLMDHVKDKRNKSNTLGRNTALALEVEEKLASCLHIMEKNGFGLTKQEVLEMVGDYVSMNQLSTPFKDNTPGEAWFHGFKTRHNLSVKKPQGVEYARKRAIDPFVVYPYFDLLENTIDLLNLRDEPSSIWNLDETSFCKDPSKTKVVGVKGHAATRVISSPGRDNTTVLLCANALGEKAPPLIVFKGKKVWDEWTTDEGFKGTSYAATENGWMETTVFENYFIKQFLMTVGEKRPILLIYDGHSSHVSLNLIEQARKENVTILKLPPHSSHVLQPLDVSVMKSFKDKWDPLLVKWQRLNIGTTLPKKEFSRLIGEIWTSIDPKVISNGFRRTGIFPPCREEISETQFDTVKLKRWKEKIHVKQPDSLLSISLKSLTQNTYKKSTEYKRLDIAHKLHLVPVTKIVNTKPNLIILHPSLQTASTSKPLLSTKNNQEFQTTATISLSKNTFETHTESIDEKLKDTNKRIQIIDDVKVQLNTTFEELLLSKVKAGNNLKVKRRKIADGAEVITHDDVLRRKMEESVKNIKIEKSVKKTKKSVKKRTKNLTKLAKKKKAKREVSISTSESDESLPKYNDESDYEHIDDFRADTLNSTANEDLHDDEVNLNKENFSDNVSIDLKSDEEIKSPRVGNWLLVKFATKKTLKHYVGVVIEINSQLNPMVQYLRKVNTHIKRMVFSYPQVEDISELRHTEDIVLFLPDPIKERRGIIYFDGVSFYNYNIQ